MSVISPSNRYVCLLLVTFVSLFIPSALPFSPAWSSSHASTYPAPALRPGANREPIQHARISDAFAKLPLRFEPGADPTYSGTKFFARGSNYRILVAPTEAVIELPIAAASSSRAAHQMIQLRMQMVGASRTARVVGSDALAGKSNYFAGSDPSKWRTNISTYARVQVENVYRGVNVVYYGQGQALEYDFNLAAGTDVKTIRLRFDGAAQLRVDPSGDLLMDTAGGVIRQHKPVAYQLVNGTRRDVAAGYIVNRKGEVGFAVGAYDVSQPLVIDPVLSYSQYLFIDISDSIQSIALDGAGNAYVTGWYYTNQPRNTLGNEIYALTGPADMFVFKFDPTGSTILYSTFLSGGISATNQNSVFYQSYGLAVDAAGNAYVTGAAGADNYPITPGAFQSTLQGATSAVVSKLSPAGNLLYSTYLGGSTSERAGMGRAVNAGRAIAVDGAGNAYVTGVTDANNFPLLNPAQAQNQGGTCVGGDVLFPCAGEAFVTKLNPTGTGLVYSTYLGGSTNDYGNAIAVDGAGNAYVAGLTFAQNFPTVNAVQPAAASLINEAFVAKLNAAGNTLIYSTYLGGRGSDTANGLAVDAAGNAYVTGTTTSTDFPTTPGAFQPVSANKPVFKSANGGGLWQAATAGIPGDQSVASLQVDLRNPATLYATTNAGLYKSTNGGGQWQLLRFGARNLVIDPNNPAMLYATLFLIPVGELLFRSTDGGKIWSSLSSQDLNVGNFTGLAIDPTDSATLYASLSFSAVGPPGIYKTTNGGANWKLANKGIAPNLPSLIAVNPRKPARVFAAVTPNALFRSKNRAKKWQPVFTGGVVRAIVFDPNTKSQMYVATSNGIFKSGDGGSTWNLTGLSGNITALAIDPLTPSTLYATRNAAGVQDVFKSTDSGDHWTAINNGLNGNQLVALAVDPQTPGTVYVAGTGGGAEAFVTKLDPTGTTLAYSTYLGGENDDGGFGIAVDKSGNAYITGRTRSIQFPTLNSLQLERRNAGTFYDAFITKLNAAGAALVYSTTFGGNHDDMGLCIAQDSAGVVYIGGTTRSEDLPALNPAPVHLGNLQYAFIAKISE